LKCSTREVLINSGEAASARRPIRAGWMQAPLGDLGERGDTFDRKNEKPQGKKPMRLRAAIWMFPAIRCLAFWLCAIACIQAPAHAARLALVIGNAAYTEGPLRNPVNDVRAMEQKLVGLGFKVNKVENLKRREIGRTLTAFANSIKAGDEVVVFYAGHGVQVKGVNYLPAVDAEIQSEEDVPLNSLNLNTLLERLDEAKAGLKLVFLDACRNNPYARSFRSGDRGLARVSAAPTGTLLHFATRPGSVAADGSGPMACTRRSCCGTSTRRVCRWRRCSSGCRSRWRRSRGASRSRGRREYSGRVLFPGWQWWGESGGRFDGWRGTRAEQCG
jgi:hypothetical protein